MEEYFEVGELQIVCSALAGGLTWLLVVGAGLSWRRCRYQGSSGYVDDDVETNWRSVIGYVGGGMLIAMAIIHLIPDTLDRFALHGNSGPILVLVAFLLSHVISNGGLGSFGETVEQYEGQPTLSGFHSFGEPHGGIRSVSQYNSMDSNLGQVSPQPHHLSDDEQNEDRKGILKDFPPSYGATTMVGDHPPSYNAAVMPEGTDGVAEPLTSPAPKRMWLLLTVMFLHCLAEGTVLGSLYDKEVIMGLATKIIVHKSVIAFFVGVKIFSTIEKVLMAIVVSTVFACSTPAGVALSMIFKLGELSAFHNFVVGLAGGVVLHIGVSEGGMEGGLEGPGTGWRRQAGVVAGAGIVAMLAILVPPYAA